MVTALVGHQGATALVVPGPMHLALGVAAVVAWRFRNPALPVLAAVAAMIVVEVLS